MLWRFKKKRLSERLKAIRNGRLVDMQLPPFRQFNQILNNDYPMVMTKAAYQACVQLPDEVKGKAEVPANARWGIVFLSFMERFQHREDDVHEGTFDVNVLMPGGFQVPKTVKVVVDNDFDGENAFVFMMPDQSWPGCIAN
jgi:cytochrome c1